MADKKLDMKALGTSGLKHQMGKVEEEFHPKLRGDYGPKTYREMADNSSAVGAALSAIEALVRQVDWRVEPADQTPESLDQATFIDECILDMDMTFEDFISETLSSLPYGWAYFEVLYKLRKGMMGDKVTYSGYDDGKFGWRKFALRAQDTLDRWEFDEEGDILGMYQRDPNTNEEFFIPIEKALLFRTTVAKNNPEGRSILRNAVVDYWFLRRIQEIEAIGIERDMTGLLTMEVPAAMLSSNADAKTKALLQSLEEMLGGLKRDEREFAIIPAEVNKKGQPTGYKLKLLATGGNRQIDTTKVKQYYRVAILQSLLAQFLQLGTQNVGSFALASSQTNLFAMAISAILSIISSTFNRSAIGPLMQLNNVPKENWPELTFGDIEERSLAELGSFIQVLANAGQLPDDPKLQNQLLSIAKLTPPDTEEDHHENQE